MANYYILRIKKGKLELEVNSDNKYFVLMQYEKLFKEFDTPKKARKNGKVEPEPKLEPMPEPVVETIEQTEQEIEPEIESEPEQIIDAVVEPEPEPEIKNFEPAKEIDEFLYKKAKEKEEEPPEKQKNKFQDIIKQKLHEAGEILAPKKEELPEVDPEELELAEELQKSFAESEEEQEDAKDPQKVYDILGEKLAELPEEDKARLNLNKTEEKKSLKPAHFKKLEDLIYLKKPQTKLDYLLLTSYYMQENEDLDKYSLKQINSYALPHTKEPIDHSVIHEAVAHEYLEVVPDYLGTTDITEYKLTNEGRDYILNEL